MAKGWPTISKGLFSPAFKKGQGEAKGTATRETGHKEPSASQKITVKNRMVIPARSPQTVKGRMKYG